MSTDKRDYEISLLRDCLATKGCGIVDIFGYVSSECGGPIFKITRIILDTGKAIYVEGEHDLPYLRADGDLMRLPGTGADQ